MQSNTSTNSCTSKAPFPGPFRRNERIYAPSRRARQARLNTTCEADKDAVGNDKSSFSLPKSEKPTNNPTSTTRRSALQLTSVGALHALASRSIFSADSAFAAAAATGATSPTTLAKQLKARVQEFTLSNGMRFIVSERKSVPVVSFHTYADIGAYDEADGVTGVAHLLEHLAFKGTPRIGTTDFKKEAPLLDAMDDVFYESLEVGEDNKKTAATLNAQLESLLEEAGKIAVPNAYGAMLSREGAVGLNAATTHDSTKYYCSLPANKLELWFALEAERFQAPVFRELYSERKVVFEERRMRVDNAALGPFQEEFAQRSLTNNYKRPVIGYETDLLKLGRREVASFFAEHYGPRSLTVAIVGDVKVGKVRQLAEKYFGGWRSAATPGAFCSEGGRGDGEGEALPIPPLLDFSESSFSSPTRNSTPPIGSGSNSRELLAKSIAGPAVLRAFYRPCIRDTLATSNLDLINDTLTGSRSARLYRNLVEEGKALTVSSYASFPAEKHPGQFIMYGIPAPGVSPEELDLLMQAEVASLVERGPTETEVRRYAKAAKMGILETLQSNSALASTLASYQVLLGGWEEICNDLERVESLSPTTAAASARKYLRGDNSFVGYIEKI